MSPGRGRKPASHRQALADQAVAVLRGANGFPMSTGAIATALGGRLVGFDARKEVGRRPPCWPDDLEDPGLDGTWSCARCGVFHRPPVWRKYQAEDVRPLLNRLAREGQIEKVVLDNTRDHYWRRDDTDGVAVSPFGETGG